MTRIPRLVATDLDGTLLRSDGTISERSRAALNRAEESGAVVVFVTGRPVRWMSGVADAVGRHGLAICANGAVVYDVHAGRAVRQHPVAPELGQAVVTALRGAIPGLAFAVEHADGAYGREAGYRSRIPSPPLVMIDSVDRLLERPAVKILARHDGYDGDRLLAEARSVAGHLAELTHSSRDGLLEISAPGISKASTLALLAAEHGLSAQDAVTFGDMPNDLPMLAWAGTAYAVANAHPDVLAAVPNHAPANDEDGVAAVLEQIFR